MTKSIWRASHLILAAFSTLFLLVASLTGGLLAFEPIINKAKPYQTFGTDDISIATTLEKLQKNNTKEIYTLKNEKKGHIVAQLSDGRFYINPQNGKILGKIQRQTNFFKFLTNLHRSLFLKTKGRATIGIVSFILVLITITGILLILKRQAFFSNVTKETSEQFYHISLGRLLLIPILIIAITGVYLSLQRFKFIPKDKKRITVNKQISNKKNIAIKDFPVFKNTMLSDMEELKFPFSEEQDDYFHLKLKDKEQLIHQFSGQIMGTKKHSIYTILSKMSFDLHTGYTGIIWAIILLFSCGGILYFIYSGFLMTYKRFKGKIKNKFKSNECEYILLVGSENGNTQLFAKMLYKGLLTLQKKVFITTLNNYKTFPKMKHLIILTATYGDGEAPSNASKFAKLLTVKNINTHSFYYSVVGFGSLSYPKFCQFAKEVNTMLQTKKEALKFLDLHTVNNKSFEEFSSWLNRWSRKELLEIQVDKSIIAKRKKQDAFKVIERKINAENEDKTFLLTLKPIKKIHFSSGDLLGVYPHKETHERLYSIAKINNTIVLSVKLHNKGLCSNYLNTVAIESNVNGFIQKNKSFHFPKKATKVIMIATGTGIAPFLGMMQNNIRKTSIDLYFGVRDEKSAKIYVDYIHQSMQEKKITNFFPAYSRVSENKVYVQDLILKDIYNIINALDNKAVIMLCGSIAMQKAVFDILDKKLKENNKSISYYKNKNQILVDCY